MVALCDDLRQVAGVCNMVRYYITYNRARNKRTRIHARAREGLEMPCVALWGVLRAFWECRRVVIAAKI